jgi:Mn2+/Fe2+ NRAMP family transporter
MILFGAVCALIPGLPVIQWLLSVQVLNGALLPVMLVFILRLTNDTRLVGDLKNSRLQNALGWGTLILISIAVILLLGNQLLGFLE